MTQPAGPSAAPTTCVRHPDRPTGLTCTRCGRPACPDCLREASVGYQCVDCVAEGSRGVRRGTTVAGADSGGRTRPLVTPVLVALNLAVFVVTVVQSGDIRSVSDAEIFQQWTLAPAAVAAGEWWRLLTSGFLHFGVLHVALNMIALWMLGQAIEPALGRGRFLALYLLSLLGGSAAIMLFYPALSFVAGASGAVFGLLGGYVIMLIRLKLPLSSILPTIVLNAAISVVVPGVSLLGHVGGFLAGAAATAALVYARPADRNRTQALGLGALLVVLLLLCVLGVYRFL